MFADLSTYFVHQTNKRTGSISPLSTTTFKGSGLDKFIRQIGPRFERSLKYTARLSAVTPGHSGRVVESQTAVELLKTDLLGRLGRLFQTHLEPGQNTEEDVSPAGEINDNERGVLPVLGPPVRPNRPLIEHELRLLRRAGMENDPVVMTALNLFNGTIFGVSESVQRRSNCAHKDFSKYPIAALVKQECAINNPNREEPNSHKNWAI